MAPFSEAGEMRRVRDRQPSGYEHIEQFCQHDGNKLSCFAFLNAYYSGGSLTGTPAVA